MILDVLCKRQSLWERYLRSWGCQEAYVGDIIQEMYLKIHSMKNPEKVLFGSDDVNIFYIWKTLKTLYFDHLKSQGKMVCLDEDWDIENTVLFEQEDSDVIAENLAFERLIDKIDADIKIFDDYNRKIWNVYSRLGYSMQKISDGMGVSKTAIFNTIDGHRDLLREWHKEDYEDYINKDYDKI